MEAYLDPLPASRPSILANMTTDPQDLLDQSELVSLHDIRANAKQWTRTAVFKLLLQCFALQIRYGCENDECTTSTCFSFQKRSKGEPVRRPTPLTARDHAFVLAGTNDPLSRLCTNSLRTEIDGNERVDVAQVRAYVKWELENGEPAIWKQRMQELGAHHGNTDAHVESDMAEPSATDSAAGQNRAPPKAGLNLDVLGAQSTMDKGSLVQNLFNSKKMRQIFGAQEKIREDEDEDDIDTNLPEIHQGYADDKFGRALSTYDGWMESARAETGQVDDTDRTLVTQFPSRILPLLSLVKFSPNTPASRGVFQANSIGHFVFMALRHTLSTPERLLHQWKSAGPPLVFSDLPQLRLGEIEDTDGTVKTSIQNLNVHIRDVSGPCGVCCLAGADILDSLWHSLDILFVPPAELAKNISTKNLASHMRYLKDEDAAGIIYVTVLALVGSLPASHPAVLERVLQSRRSGQSVPSRDRERSDPKNHMQDTHRRSMQAGVSDAFESEPAIRLAEKMVSALAARRSYWYAMRELRGDRTDEEHQVFPIMFMVMAYLTTHLSDIALPVTAQLGPISEAHQLHSRGLSPGPILLEWFRTVFRISWDGNCIVNRWKVAGAVLDSMNDIYQFHHRENNIWGLGEAHYNISTLGRYVKPHKAIPEYLDWMQVNPPGSKRHKNERHLLEYPFVFESLLKTHYFRLMLYYQMNKEWQASRAIRELHGHFSWLTEPSASDYQCPDADCDHAMCERLRFSNRQRRRWLDAGYEPESRFPSNFWNRDLYLRNKLKGAEAKFLVLDIERQNVLESAFNQLWGRERRELLKPLKVVMRMDGKDEDAADHGGVSQEFFRIVLGKAFEPEYGLFTITEEQTRISWFQPLSSEPLQTFELLGLLFGMAVYNGITLPVNLPAAMYQILCGRGPTESYIINDAWPALHQSLHQLAHWDVEQGDVEDVIARDYAFSFEANGTTYTIDMIEEDPDTMEWPQAPSEGVPAAWTDDTRELQPVTNNNRHDFIDDYKDWLVEQSVRPQLDAFVKGFRHLIPPSFTSLLTSPLLRRFVEGFRQIDVQQLRHATSYAIPSLPSSSPPPTFADDYSPSHPTVQHFWSVVQGYDQAQLRKLLTFVTANDRVPVQGYRAIGFSIEKHGDPQRLPTSSTCFGKLFLPAYESQEVLEKMLRIAIDEGMAGFGFM